MTIVIAGMKPFVEMLRFMAKSLPSREKFCKGFSIDFALAWLPVVAIAYFMWESSYDYRLYEKVITTLAVAMLPLIVFSQSMHKKSEK